MTANDTRIKTLRENIDKKRASLKGRSSKFTAVTNLSLELDGQRYNLNVLDQPALLYLGSKLQAFIAGAEALWHSSDGLVLGGYKASLWIADIRGKVESLAVKNEESQLAKLDAQLKTLLSAEAQTDLAIADIEAMLA